MTSVQTGNQLEDAIHALLRTEIDAGRFFAKKSSCKLYKRKGYYSEDRKAKIIFDVSIEIYLPGAHEYSVLVLIECKNYTHTVPVNDVEEFYSKVQQVGAANSKAILASTAAFQSGTREFAKSTKMGLLRYFDAEHFKWELHRSPSASARGVNLEAESSVVEGLSQPAFRSEVFDLFLQTPTRVTNSLWDLFDDIVATSTLSSAEVRKVSNSRNCQSNLVPFREKGELEALADETLDDIAYDAGTVSLASICSREAKRAGLVVEHQTPVPDPDSENPPLGRIEFSPLRILLFAYDRPHPARDRFTLAHELAHHLLGHGSYMTRESCDESDFVLHRRRIDDGTDIARLEYQANYFAASLLMPRKNFIEDFWKLLEGLDIRSKGFGPLYVDNQQCNIDNYFAVTAALMNRYKVSRASATIRLESLGLLRDARKPQGPAPLQASLLSALESPASPFWVQDDDSAI
jgi:Zn-dependent peptidase ImmA (M78 family)